jgi:hypothetical protein
LYRYTRMTPSSRLSPALWTKTAFSSASYNPPGWTLLYHPGTRKGTVG